MRTSLAVPLGLFAVWLCGACTARPVTITGALRGTLTTARGAPLLDGTVRLSGAVEAAVQCGADGTFQFERLPVGQYLVAATADDTLEGVTTRLVQVRGDDDAAIALSLTGVGKVRGRVTLEDEPLAAGTRIVVGGSTQITLTGVDGTFVVERVPEGSASLFAVHEGWEPSALGAVDILRGDERSLDERQLKKTSVLTTPLTGKTTVPDATDHSGVVVTVAGTNAQALSTSDGTFVLPNVPLGIVTLELRRGPYTSSVGPLWITASTPPLVLAAKPFVLPSIDLMFGERIGGPRAERGTLTADGSLRFATVRSAFYGEDKLVATNSATGAQQTLEHASFFHLHPDGQRAIVYRYTDLPAQETSLVLWDPKTNTTTLLEKDVAVSAEYLDARQEILVRRPTLRLVPVDGSPTRSLAPTLQSSTIEITFDAAMKTAVVQGNGEATWIDLDTNTALYTSPPGQPAWLKLPASGQAVLISTQGKLSYRMRASGSEAQLASAWAQLTVAPYGRYVSYLTSSGAHLFDLVTETEIAAYEEESAIVFSPDGRSAISLRNGQYARGRELVVLDLPSGSSHPKIPLGNEVHASTLSVFDRGVYYEQRDADGTARIDRLDLDSNLVETVFSDYTNVDIRPNAGKAIFTRTTSAASKTLVVDLALRTAPPKELIGRSWYVLGDANRLVTRDGQRLVYHNLTTSRSLALVDAWHVLASGTSPTIEWFPDGTLTIRRAPDEAEIEGFPSLQLNEGLFAGNPDQVAQ